MSFMDGFKARNAVLQHQRGNEAEAKRRYEALYASGYVSCMYMLPYSVLLLKEGGEKNYELVKEILKKAEKAPDINAERRQQLLMNYAVAQYKLGHLDSAIHLLEESHQHGACGMTYEALGYLYIEAGDGEKALKYNQEALDYDDESPVTLDNMGQTYYRLLNDKEKARKYFEKALEIKDNQIDTLYFLAKYDVEEGNVPAAIEKLEKCLEGRFSPLNFAKKDQVEKELEALKKQ